MEFIDIFSRDLKKEPANINPMILEADEARWKAMRNDLPPRVQSPAKDQETRKQVFSLMEGEVIIESQAPNTKKSYRFCVDYRMLNLCLASLGWPIPNIMALLIRLGKFKPKMFAVMDLTKGYYQAPMAKASQWLTAFTTTVGVYQWTRVPMGIKSAPAFFQHAMQTEVLYNLMYKICEVYLDDIIVHGQKFDDFVSNLRQVFARLRQHRVTLNPDKCVFGVKECKYLGHVIDDSGISFSQEKREKVFMIELPLFVKGLKSFLGVVNYFRNHIAGFANTTKPLFDLVGNYSKNKYKKIEWT